MSELKLENIRKRYADVDAVSDFSLEVAEGELVSLLGPSGCGKSTTLRLIAGLIDPDEGEISIAGRVVSSGARGVADAPDKRNIGLVFQSYALWPHMTVAKNVAYGLHARKVPKNQIGDRVAAALGTVRMDAYAERYPSELSGGQQQRVALARAIVYDPKVLLLDEPLSNLDAKLREHMRVETRQLQQRLGFTAIYVTHDQSEAMAISDRIVVMHEGRMHQVGTPEDIYENPATSFVAEFIGTSNIIPGQVVGGARKGEIAKVDVGRGEQLLARAAVALQPGDPAAVCLRAETVLLARDEDRVDGVRWRDGIVETASYQGDCWHYFVKVLGTTLQVRAAAGLRFDPGDAVHVGVAPEHCIATRGVEHARTPQPVLDSAA